MKKIVLVTVVLIFCIPSMFAQELPNTASLVKYGEIALGLFTEFPQIIIPTI